MNTSIYKDGHIIVEVSNAMLYEIYIKSANEVGDNYTTNQPTADDVTKVVVKALQPMFANDARIEFGSIERRQTDYNDTHCGNKKRAD